MEATRDSESRMHKDLDRSYRGEASWRQDPEQKRGDSRQLLPSNDGSTRQPCRCQSPTVVAAAGLAVTLLVAPAVFWLRWTSRSPWAPDSRSALTERQRVAALAAAHLREVSQQDLCCEEQTARCLACKASESLEDFCGRRANAHVEGCGRQCCHDEKAVCLACQAGQTLGQFCSVKNHSKVVGCKGVCCSEMTADCLACMDHMSTQEYCARLENARVSGCEESSTQPRSPKSHQVSRLRASQLSSTSPAPTTSLTDCCAEHSAKCLACKAQLSIGEYCLDPASMKVPGCGGFCGLIESGYVYPGGNLFDVKNVASAEACCHRCRSTPNCTSWSWGRPDSAYHRWCYLKNQMEFIRRKDDAFVSGLPGRNTMTFQIKNRHGICLDWNEHLHLEECGGSSKETQQWYIDRKAGVIGTRHGLCADSVEYLSPGGGIHLQPCTANVPSQTWAFDGISGLIRHVRGFCMAAPQLNKAGSKVQMWPCNSHSAEQVWSLWNTQVLGQSATIQAMRLEALTTTTTTTATATRTTTTTTTKRFVRTASGSLFCWSLMLPWGYEHLLLNLAYSMRRGIFACNEFAVYSSSVLNITGNGSNYVQTGVVHHDLHCKIGGQFMTALNTPIFIHVWKKVLRDGRYRYHDWTIKADPDTVFFPHRVLGILAKKEYQNPQAKGGIFLNNCQFGLHGPLEVISRRSLELYAEGWETCRQPPQEDVFVQSCLRKLGATEVDAFDLLAEEHCESKGWSLCGDEHAAFHPFKTVKRYAGCLKRADQYDTGVFQQVRVLHA